MKHWKRPIYRSTGWLASVALAVMLPMAVHAQAGGGGGAQGGQQPPVPWELLKGMDMSKIMEMIGKIVEALKGKGGGGGGGGGAGNAISDAERYNLEQQLAALKNQLAVLQLAVLQKEQSDAAVVSNTVAAINYNTVGDIVRTTTVTRESLSSFAKTYAVNGGIDSLYVAPVRNNGSLGGEGLSIGAFLSGTSGGTIYIGGSGNFGGDSVSYISENNGGPIRIGATDSSYGQQVASLASDGGVRIGGDSLNGGQIAILTPAQIQAAKERFRKGYADGQKSVAPVSGDADYMEGYRAGLNGQPLTV